MARHRWATGTRVALAAALAVAPAGCGSDGSTEGSSTTIAVTETNAPVSSSTTPATEPVETAASTAAVATTDDSPLETTGSTTEATEQPPASADGAAATFPVTIQHKYGETVIEREPQRVVSVGYTDQDAILALGVTPLTVLDWYGDQPYGVWPWAQDELGDAQPVLLSGVEADYEAIARVDPDLIVGVSSGMSEEIYATLSAIAPTIAQSGEYADYAEPWQSGTLTIARALGKEPLAQDMIDDIADRFAEIRAAHPEFEGATGTVAFFEEDGTMGAYAPDDLRGRLLTNLGFVATDEILELAGTDFFATFSTERMELVDTDVLLWITGDLQTIDAIKANPIRQTLRAFVEGREIFMDQLEIGAAMSFSSLLSLPYFLDFIEPRLVAAVDGDPSTEVG